jgi:RimJ/RimL family protein N-acetyltransferase
MIECPTDLPALPGLFDPHIPNNPSLWAVFSGRHTGQALVDDLQQPTQCLVHTGALLTYASRQMSQDFLTMAIEQFQRSDPVWLIRSKADPPAPPADRVAPRLEFYAINPRTPSLSALRASLPEEFEPHPIDQALLERCLWRDDMAFYAGSLEKFFRHGIGMCLMYGDEIIVEAYASALGSPYAEIGAITHEPYRGRGYATITVAFLVEALEKLGFQAYWSCDSDNLASARVARKLGFTIEKSYEIWEYPVIHQ